MIDYTDPEVKKVMEETGMDLMQAIRHVECRRFVSRLGPRAAIYPRPETDPKESENKD